MDYPFFDAHCDTMSEIFRNNGNFKNNSLHIDFERMQRYPRYIQVFAAFVDKKKITVSPKEHIKKIIDTYKRETDNVGICRCKSAEQLENSKYSAILAIEGGEAIEGNLENLEKFYESGVRIMTLTWNYRNEIADGITEKEGRGLTAFGKRTMEKMNELGMIADVSHLCERGFWDVAALSKKPFIVSHSNVKALCSHERNLSDEQIKEVIKSGGVIGMNFYPLFLDDTGKCTMERIVDHMEYILNLGGENNIGIGSDFDGIDCLPDGIQGIESMNRLVCLMENRGFGKSIIEKITFGNFMRVIKANFI